MRSNMIKKRALEQVNSKPGIWDRQQGTDEADMPGNKSSNPVKPEFGKDATRRRRASEQPEQYPKDKREGQEEAGTVEPSAKNPAPKKRTVKLDQDTKAGETPSAWGVDNTREQWRKAKAATPGSWAVDNTREMPKASKPITGDDQIEEKLKMGSLELYEPKTAAEIDMIIASSPSWVASRVASGSVAHGEPRFIINASQAVAVVSAAGEVFDGGYTPTEKFAHVLSTNKFAAEGGAEEEEETEEETSVDSSVVTLLEACKREWTSLGEPVNPGTWPKEIERAILALNDDLVAAIQKIEDKLVEGEFYSKNVDEGVQEGGSNLQGLNVAEPEFPVEEAGEMEEEVKTSSAKTADLKVVKPSSIEEMIELAKGTHWGFNPRFGPQARRMAEVYYPNVLIAVDTTTNKAVAAHDSKRGLTFDANDAQTSEYDHLFNKTSSKKAAAEDITSTETKKALKHVQSLKDDIASKFFDFKKTVQSANDSTLVKSVGEGLVAMKGKLEDVEKVLLKQLTALETAEDAIQKKKNEKKSSQSKTAACPTCGAKVMQDGKDTNGVMCPNCAAKTTVKPGTKPAPKAPTAPAQAPVSPAAPSAVKQYGTTASKKLSSLNLALGE